MINIQRAAARPIRPTIRWRAGIVLWMLVSLGGPIASLAAASDPAAPVWKVLSEDDGIVVEMRRSEDGRPVVRGRKVLAQSPAAVMATLLDLEGFARWVPGLREWHVLERGPDQVLVYGCHRLPWPLADRDYVVRYDWQRSPGRLLLTAHSVELDQQPPRDGIVRLAQVDTTWNVEAVGNNATRVQYTYRGDLRGSRMPRVLRQYGWRKDVREAFESLDAEVERVSSGDDPSPPSP